MSNEFMVNQITKTSKVVLYMYKPCVPLPDQYQHKTSHETRSMYSIFVSDRVQAIIRNKSSV